MSAKICPHCGLPADTKTGVHNFTTGCIQALKEDSARKQTEIERMRRMLDAIDALARELAGMEKGRAR